MENNYPGTLSFMFFSNKLQPRVCKSRRKASAYIKSAFFSDDVWPLYSGNMYIIRDLYTLSHALVFNRNSQKLFLQGIRSLFESSFTCSTERTWW